MCNLVFKIVLILLLLEAGDIKPVRTKEGKSYWKIPLGDDDATR